MEHICMYTHIYIYMYIVSHYTSLQLQPSASVQVFSTAGATVNGYSET